MLLPIPPTACCDAILSRRFFSTTSRIRAPPKANAMKLLPKYADPPPPYPYEHSYFYKQRNHGLYGGAMIQFGNNVAPKSGVKTRRRWHPNVVHKQLYSASLGRMLRLKISTRVLRTIDKVGGLDEYLLGSTPARLKELGEEGWRLRWAVFQAPSMQRRLRDDTELRRRIGPMATVNATERVEDAMNIAGPAAATRPLETDAMPVEEDAQEAIDVEERIQQRLDETTHLREEAPPPSIWQRLTGRTTQPSSR